LRAPELRAEDRSRAAISVERSFSMWGMWASDLYCGESLTREKESHATFKDLSCCRARRTSRKAGIKYFESFFEEQNPGSAGAFWPGACAQHLRAGGNPESNQVSWGNQRLYACIDWWPLGGSGSWSLVVKCKHGKGVCSADFSAALTMERSDEGITENGHGDFNGDNPADRMAHTHHITLADGQVTTITGGIEIKGPAMVSGNGAFPPPFQTNKDLSALTIDITGGNAVDFSNIALTFGDQAAGHFGTLPLHGVVRGSSDKSDK